MSFFDTTGFSGGDPAPGYSFTDSLGTSQQLGADPSYDAPATIAPIYPGQDAGGDSAPSGWGSYFQQLGSTVLGYAITKDAVKSGLTGQPQPAGAPAGNAQAAVQPKQAGMSPLMLLLVAGGVVFVAVKLAK